MPRPTCFMFDFGNVICFFDHMKACRQLAALTNPATGAREVYDSVFGSGLERQYERGEVAPADFVGQLRTRLGIAAPDESIATAWSDIFQPNEPVMALIADLKAAGARLVLASNTNELHARWFRSQYARTIAHFDQLILSHEVGARKPETAFYQRCLEACHAAPADCFYIDDREDFVNAAARLGIRGVTYDAARTDLREVLKRLEADTRTPPPAV